MTYIRHLLKAYPVSCFYILMILVTVLRNDTEYAATTTLRS